MRPKKQEHILPSGLSGKVPNHGISRDPTG